ncbi:MAG: four helix bundle protein [Saprospiraceae bacterium]|nr:four helix bundle protein [Saprospiraceae bacterium]
MKKSNSYSFRQTTLNKKAFQQALEIFELTKGFPKEETYSLTDQIRRSSRSVCSNYAEAHRKRRFRKYFISKLSDCDMENTETLVWLDFSYAFKYITLEQFEYHQNLNEEVGRLIGHAISNPDKY